MNISTLNTFQSKLQISKKIVVIPHKNPDGDAMGSVLGMYHYLIGKGYQVSVVSPNDYPDFLKWLPGSESVVRFDSQLSKAKKIIQHADMAIFMDFNDLNRVGNDMEQFLLYYRGITVMIDHHQEPKPIADIVFSDTKSCATAQILFQILEKLEGSETINSDIATCIYTGILTDSGSFRFPNTTPETHRIAAQLIEKGANASQIYDLVFDQNSYKRMQLLGCALKNMVVLEDFKTAYTYITQEEKQLFEFQKGDTEGFVNHTLSVKNVIFGAIFIEDEEQEIVKISFRSKGSFSVNQFARNHFEGGGHDNAAGGRSSLNVPQTIEKFVSLLKNYQKQLQNSY